MKDILSTICLLILCVIVLGIGTYAIEAVLYLISKLFFPVLIIAIVSFIVWKAFVYFESK